MPAVKVAKVSDIPPGVKKSFRASKTRVLLVNVDGKIFGIQSVCTHHANPLFSGKLKGKILWCDNHYASFDVTTGALVDPPVGSDYLKLDPLKTYPVKIDGQDVIVEVPE